MSIRCFVCEQNIHKHKKCSLCGQKVCQDCSVVENPLIMNIFGKRLCIGCNIVVAESKESALTRRDSIEKFVKYSQGEDIPYDELVKQVEIMSLLSASKSNNKNLYDDQPGYNISQYLPNHENQRPSTIYSPSDYNYAPVPADPKPSYKDPNIPALNHEYSKSFNAPSLYPSLDDESFYPQKSIIDPPPPPLFSPDLKIQPPPPYLPCASDAYSSLRLNLRTSVYEEIKEKTTDPNLDYKTLKKIGNGGSGLIYIVQNLRTSDYFAAKLIIPGSEREKAMILNEISLTVNSHCSYIIKYYEFYSFNREIWIIEELMACSLTDLILDRPGLIPEHIIAFILRGVLQGLAYLHSRQRLHRDIKSDNVLISKSGDIKIADLGFAAQLDVSRSNRNTFAGTLLWMSPEIVNQQNYDTKTDIWSLGIVAIELAEGEPPNYTETQPRIINNIIRNEAPRLKQEARWSEEYKDFIRRCLVKDPKARASAVELLKSQFILRAVENQHEFVSYFQGWVKER